MANVAMRVFCKLVAQLLPPGQQKPLKFRFQHIPRCLHEVVTKGRVDRELECQSDSTSTYARLQ